MYLAFLVGYDYYRFETYIGFSPDKEKLIQWCKKRHPNLLVVFNQKDDEPKDIHEEYISIVFDNPVSLQEKNKQ